MMQERLNAPDKQPLFELCTERNPHWSPSRNVDRVEPLEEIPTERK